MHCSCGFQYGDLVGLLPDFQDKAPPKSRLYLSCARLQTHKGLQVQACPQACINMQKIRVHSHLGCLMH